MKSVMGGIICPSITTSKVNWSQNCHFLNWQQYNMYNITEFKRKHCQNLREMHSYDHRNTGTLLKAQMK